MIASPRQHTTVVNGAEIAWVEWGDKGDPLLLLSHATGFHSRCWDEVVANLDGYHIIATDHRGHGKSSNSPPYGWDQFAADLTAFVIDLDLRDISGVGHSMGGHCMVAAAANEPGRFRHLTLFDPVIFDPSAKALAPDMEGTEHPVARRRNVWESPQQMVDDFKNRSPFSRWHADVLRDYCRHGLVLAGDAYELACPPDVEAGIYASALNTNIYERIPLVECHVKVVRAKTRGFQAAKEDFSLSPTWPELANQFVRSEDKYLPEHSHFMPMEDPVLTASIIAAR